MRSLKLRLRLNRNYDAAQKIFNSAAIQAMIKVQHQGMYSSSTKKHGLLSTGDEFLDLMKYGLVGGYRRYEAGLAPLTFKILHILSSG